MNACVGCPAASLQEQLAGQPEPERASFLLSLIRAEVAAVVGEKTPLINAESPWRQLGIYREFATELRGRLAAATGQRIPATVFFDYPTPAALMGYLRAELLGERIVLAPPAREGTRPGDDPIAIVGMACRFPGACARRSSCGISWPRVETRSKVTIAACDVTDKESLAGLLSSLPTEHRLTAVVHAAGISGRFAPATEVDAAEFAEVVAAKVAGAIHLDTLLEGHQLDAFVLISSIAGVWGSGGQVAYAAGNAFLDALAHQRRARGLVATSVACGPWAEGGMAADPTISTHLLQRGLPAMAPQVATTALWQAVATGDTASVVADVDWQRFLPTFTAARASHLFDDLPEAGGASGPTDVDLVENVWRPRLAGASEPERGRILLELVRAEAAEILGHAAPSDIDSERQFLDLGFDSLAAVELRTRLAPRDGLDAAGHGRLRSAHGQRAR